MKIFMMTLLCAIITASASGLDLQNPGRINNPCINQGLKINIPETNTVVYLNEKVTFGGADYFKGDYSEVLSSNILERGSVFYDLKKIIVISKVNPKNQTRLYYAPVFIVSNQGSGNFYYLGLFVYDKIQQQCTHIDSYFLGDRIKNIKVTDEIQAVKVNFFKRYSPYQETIFLSVFGDKPRFKLYQ